MFKRPNIRSVHVGMAALMLALASFSVLPVFAQDAEAPAAEMLQDGLDALSDNQNDLAAQLFDQVVESYPGTPEADQAERELSTLKRPARPPKAAVPADAFVRRLPESDATLRMKFASDAGDRVFFAENSAVIGGRARQLIETQARWLAKRSSLRITIVGRADDSAPAEASQILSNKRAEAVREKLIASGVAATRITIDARGTRDPVATCRSVLCQAQNRHAETVISSGVMPARSSLSGPAGDGFAGGERDGAGQTARGGGAVVGDVTVAR